MEQIAIRVPWGYEDVDHLLENSIKLGCNEQHCWYATETDDPRKRWALWCDADLPWLVDGYWVPYRSLTQLLADWRERMT